MSMSNNIGGGSGSSSVREFSQFLNIAHRTTFENENTPTTIPTPIPFGCGSIGTRTKAINIGSLGDLQIKFLRFFARITIQEKDTSGFSRFWTVER